MINYDGHRSAPRSAGGGKVGYQLVHRTVLAGRILCPAPSAGYPVALRGSLMVIHLLGNNDPAFG